MKHIFDLYEDSAIATPGNTMGMGNPMPAADNTPGSEPVAPTAKTKKEKAKKRKIQEGVLGDIDTNLKAGDELIAFVKWFVGQYANKYAKKINVEDAENSLMKCTTVSDGTATIDLKVIEDDYYVKYFEADRLYITADGMKDCPVKTVKYINAKYEIQMNLETADTGNLNVEIYADNGRIYGDINCILSHKIKDSVRFGDIKCDKFRLLDQGTITKVSFGNFSVILEADLADCKNLLTANLNNICRQAVKLSKNYVINELKRTGIISPSIEIVLIK
jgi:hypothetical protein